MAGLILGVALLLVGGCVAPAQPRSASAASQVGFIYHCPGMGGVSHLDKNMVRSIRDGGFNCDYEIVNWLGDVNGPEILKRVQSNHEQARLLAGKIAARARAFPQVRIILSAHSAGNGVLAWALEDLPDDVQVDAAIMLSPALSPTYDLTRALRHVRGKVYVFSSDDDEAILGWGTTAFGTMDRQYTEAAGKVGFRMPADADAEQYAKLVAVPYDSAWEAVGHSGNHVGNMNGQFVSEVLVPLILTGQLPKWTK